VPGSGGLRVKRNFAESAAHARMSRHNLGSLGWDGGGVFVLATSGSKTVRAEPGETEGFRKARI